jgi:anti-sigma factor RsiW
MKNPHVVDLLPAYLDHAMDGPAAARIKDHLNACAECRAEEQALAASWNALAALAPIEPSPDFRARFWARIRREEDEAAYSWRRLAPLFAGFAGLWAAGAALGVYLFLRTPASSYPPSISALEDSSLSAAYLKRIPEERS